MAILWKEEYSIGIKVVDEQHKEFISILNRLSQAFLTPDDRSRIQRILQELAGYAERHFVFEEEYFRKFDYPESEAHKEEHKVFRLKLQNLQNRFNRGEELLEYDLFDFMNHWLLVHVLGEDKKFVKCFKEHGLE